MSAIAPTQARQSGAGGLGPALSAVPTRLGLVALLYALAALGWWWTAGQMAGMDNGPWSSLGSFGWFLGVWIVMMAAMMFPSVAPTIALYSIMTKQRSPRRPLEFAAGYLVTWTAAGVVAFVLGAGLTTLFGGLFAWERGGHWAAGGTLVVAAVYELTPLKDICLAKCRSPLGFLLGAWREGWSGALRMGAKNGAWCVGCCWALMASLFALGVMSIWWMAVVAGLIAVEKIVPWGRAASWGTAAVLLALGILLLAAPGAIPGLTTPRDTPMPHIMPMG